MYMYHRIISLFHIVAVSLIISACNFSPKYTRDETLVAPKKEYENALHKKLSVSELTNWWDQLDDPLTSKLVKTLIKQNLTLKEASERVIQANEAAGIKKAALIPSVVLENSASRGFAPVQSPIDGSKKRAFADNYSTDLGVSWQIDLFGKLRSAKNAAKANALATEYDLQGITHTLIADLVQRRVSIYLNEKLLQLAQENTKNAEKLYISIKKRYELGGGSTKLADIYLAKGSYEASKKDIYQFRKLIADDMYKLDVLLGQTPGTIKRTSLIRRVQSPKNINISGVPLQLLDRRPDLKASELKIVAANADIGVAIADLFPDLLINAGVGYSANRANNLFISENMSGSVLGKITTRIFAGGALRSNIKIKESRAKELSISYANKILSAIAEVESNLKADNENMLEHKSQKSALRLFELNEKQANTRYVRGVLSLNKLLDTRARTYNSHKLFIESERKLWQSRLALYLSLGGDWLGKK